MVAFAVLFPDVPADPGVDRLGRGLEGLDLDREHLAPAAAALEAIDYGRFRLDLPVHFENLFHRRGREILAVHRQEEVPSRIPAAWAGEPGTMPQTTNLEPAALLV